jgi:hypothetical protein
MGPDKSCYRLIFMDDEFFKQQAWEVRELAGKADPFIKKRLLDLADSYDARIGRCSPSTVTLLPSLPYDPVGSNSEK